MPGLTNNDNLVAGLNQAIVSLNELQGFLDNGGESPTSVTVLIEAIADNIETMRADIVAQQVAAIVAQNTNSGSIVSAINGVNLICVSQPRIGMGDFMGTETFQPDGATEFDDPPLGFQHSQYPQGSSEYYQRKCRVAHQIFNDLRSHWEACNNFGLDEIFNVSMGLAITLILSLTIEAAGTLSLVTVGWLQVAGYAATVINTLRSELLGIELSDIITAMDTYHDDLICALVESTSAQTARGDFIDVLNNGGLSFVNQTVVAVTMADWLMAWLFFAGDSETEAAIYETNQDADCSDCDATCPEYVIPYGSLVSDAAGVLTIDSVYVPGANPAGHFLSVHFGADEQGGQCGPDKDVTIQAVDNTSTIECPFRISTTAFLSGYGCGHSGWTELQDDWASQIGVQKDDVRTITLYKAGSTPFQAQIHRE